MIIIKSAEEVSLMRQAGRIVAIVLQKLEEEIRPGINTRYLDEVAVDELKRQGAEASFKGYRDFPAHLCVSVNDEVVHGIPGDRVLVDGDIVSLDFGAYYKGFHGDSAITVGVGNISSGAKELISTTEAALMVGIKAAQRGVHLSDVSAVIQEYVEARGFSVVREYCGHGIGRDLHEEPQIPNFGSPGKGPRLTSGMTLALEPMVNVGNWRTQLDDNKWTVRTSDGSLSAHFEHTIAIGDSEPEVLTLV